jgi:glycosyltransferase involved in cell wall biosynthesis
MSKRLLVLSRYSRLGASSRLRTMQYRRWLESRDFAVEYAALFDDAYLQGLYNGNRSRKAVLPHYVQRLKDLRSEPRPDLVWIEYEALPWLPWTVERALLPRGVPFVTDYDDAVYHRYDNHRHALVRWLLGKKIDRIMRSSAMVIVGNQYLAERARAAGAEQIEMVPTVVDLDSYRIAASSSTADRMRVGWIGTPETWAAFAHATATILRPVLTRHDASFRAVGAALDGTGDAQLEIVPWSEDTEVELIQSMNVGVMPLPDTPWTRGKCGYKLIQYMACGLPVVAAPVGVNAEIVDHGVNGFLATTDTEWQEAIDALLSDRHLRKRMGEAGRRKVESQYSLQIWGPRVAEMLDEVG